MKEKIIKTAFAALVLLYLCVLLWYLLFERFYGYMGNSFENLPTYRELFNPYPFTTIKRFVSDLFRYSVGGSTFRYAFIQIFGNIGMFSPLGVILPLYFPKLRKFPFFLIAFLLLDLFIEASQILTRLGYFEVDDLILNTLGACIGYLLYFLLDKICKKTGILLWK